MIPFDDGVRGTQRRRSSSTTCWSSAWARRTSRSGENFRFGHRAAGDADAAAADGRFETRVVPLVEVDGRDRLLEPHPRPRAGRRGRPARRASSGAPFQLRGEVVARRRARPRARLPDRQPRARRRASICPGHGIYACARGDDHCAAVNVGVRPTFETGRGVLVEAFLIDFDGDLYGQQLRSSSSSACAASGASTRSRRWSSRCSRDVAARHAARSARG